jgi:hypothetical protein
LSFRESIKRWPGEERAAGRLNLREYIKASMMFFWMSLSFSREFRRYALMSARKPAAPST